MTLPPAGQHDHRDLLGGPPPTLLPDPAGPRDLRGGGADPVAVVVSSPSYSAAWADLAEAALASATDDAAAVAAYAYARVGYHRGLDQLRRNGWKGFGPVPWSHEGNRGFLRSVAALGRAAARIGEVEEAERCRDLLADSDPGALDAMGDPVS